MAHIKDSYSRKAPDIVGPAGAEEFDQIGQKDTRDALERYLLDASNSMTSLLDAGCNTGVEGFRLFERGFPGIYCGADSNSRALGCALENLSGRRAAFTLADLDSLPFADQEFDITINTGVIEHLPHFASTLHELARVTRLTFILATFLPLHDGEDIITQHPDGYYLNRYNRQKLFSLLAACGFPTAKTIFKNPSDEVLVFERM